MPVICDRAFPLFSPLLPKPQCGLGLDARAETERMREDVMELCLCEFGKFVPQPNRLYRPIHMVGCESCERLAAQQVEAYGSRSPTHEELHPGETNGR